MLRNIYLVLLLIPFGLTLVGQTTLGGTLTQTLSPVTDVDVVTSTITVADASLFSAGDEVLLIQMQGAAINSTNTSSFGTVSNLDGAGAYEFNTICLVDGGTDEVTLSSPLVNTYASTGVSDAGIQLLKIDTYADIDVTTTLTADPWDGQTGGILVLSATGTVTLSADIDMSEKGFRGGVFTDEPGSPTCLSFLPLGSGLNPTYPDYYYSDYQGGGQKGEGIADFIAGRRNGQGRQATGGGGGNDHNAGGGGGANWGAGGTGSDNTAGSCTGTYPGIGGGGLSLDYGTSSILVMGGGGGAGHGNNNESYDGANGGGIIIIRASSIEGNGHAIRADGGDVVYPTAPLPPISDGVGGGGAGGAIFLQINSLGASALDVSASGGDGGDTNNATQCEGPGGGGGGGAVFTSLGAWAATVDVAGGAAGTELTGSASCSPNASAGSSGNAYFSSTVTVATGTNPFCGSVLGPEVLWLEARATESGLTLEWDYEGTVEFIQVERLLSPTHWEPLARLEAESLSWIDLSPGTGKQIYRIALIDVKGEVHYSSLVVAQFDMGVEFNVSIFPNPTNEGEETSLYLHSPSDQPWQVSVLDLSGKMVWEQSQIEGSRISLPTGSLSSGYYLVKVTQAGQQVIQKWGVW